MLRQRREFVKAKIVSNIFWNVCEPWVNPLIAWNNESYCLVQTRKWSSRILKTLWSSLMASLNHCATCPFLCCPHTVLPYYRMPHQSSACRRFSYLLLVPTYFFQNKHVQHRYMYCVTYAYVGIYVCTRTHTQHIYSTIYIYNILCIEIPRKGGSGGGWHIEDIQTVIHYIYIYIIKLYVIYILLYFNMFMTIYEYIIS